MPGMADCGSPSLLLALKTTGVPSTATQRAREVQLPCCGALATGAKALGQL